MQEHGHALEVERGGLHGPPPLVGENVVGVREVANGLGEAPLPEAEDEEGEAEDGLGEDRDAREEGEQQLRVAPEDLGVLP